MDIPKFDQYIQGYERNGCLIGKPQTTNHKQKQIWVWDLCWLHEQKMPLPPAFPPPPYLQHFSDGQQCFPATRAHNCIAKFIWTGRSDSFLCDFNRDATKMRNWHFWMSCVQKACVHWYKLWRYSKVSGNLKKALISLYFYIYVTRVMERSRSLYMNSFINKYCSQSCFSSGRLIHSIWETYIALSINFINHFDFSSRWIAKK